MMMLIIVDPHMHYINERAVVETPQADWISPERIKHLRDYYQSAIRK